MKDDGLAVFRLGAHAVVQHQQQALFDQLRHIFKATTQGPVVAGRRAVAGPAHARALADQRRGRPHAV